MKRISLDAGSAEKTAAAKEILKSVLENSPHQALNVVEIRLRVKVLDKLEAETDVILLEDLEHMCLLGAVNMFPWSRANRTVLSIIDAIANAPDHKINGE